jgi:mono/diheme cytochrome c family protein
VRSTLFLFPALFSTTATLSAKSGDDGELYFESHVRPILKAQCFHCHGEDGETKGGLDARLARFLFKGGKSGPAIAAGDPSGSHLLDLVKSGEMPEGAAKLTSAQIETLERWIEQGARTRSPEPEVLGPEHAFTEEERAWWAFQPIAKPELPTAVALPALVRNPVDLFIQEELDRHGLKPSPPAPPATILRRLALDLTGLPPSPEEVEHFTRDFAEAGADTAVRSWTERLLALPAHGERWARHWLDVAGYADSDGYSEKDPERPNAWKYRDYVIQALNDDKPFDEFVREQIAGDEIAQEEGLHADSPTPEQRARHASLLRATGFLRMAPDGTGIENTVTTRNDTIADTLKIVGTALYGMTIGCAQCHDHRYDPVTHADYHRLRAVFEPAFNPESWLTPAGRVVSILTKEQKAEADRIEAEAKKIDTSRLKQQVAFITEVLEKELEKIPEPDRDPARAAYRTPAGERTPEQIALLKKHPRVNQLSAGSLYLYDTTYKTKHADTLKKMAAEAAEVRATKPQPDVIQALFEKPGAPVPATRILHRGNPDQPRGDPLTPSDLTVLASHRQVEIPEKAENLPTTGRRLAFARAITDGRHPLLARVIVNRVWMQHFGRGLVASVADFGTLGELPSHPRLLDWLAADFMENGWSLKHLHRLITSSHTYLQSSLRDAASEEADPDNRLLSRMNLRRLEAETLRDRLLAVSGRLNARMSGPPVPVSQNESGQVIIAPDTTDSAGRQTGKIIPLHGEEHRRSIYVQIRRSRPLEIFAAFDAPAMTEANCEIRPVTTVSPQSLLLMNNGYMREYAQDFSLRLESEAATLEERVRRAFELAFCRAPSMAEESAAISYVREQTSHYEAHPAKFETVVGPAPEKVAPPATLALAGLCHALLSANEFLYLD